jgi:hypothetical protein
MKTLLKIVFILLISFSYFTDITYAAWDINSPDQINLTTWSPDWVNSAINTNDHLKLLENNWTDFTVEVGWQKWIYNTLIRIARDWKNLFFIIAWLYFLILVIRLLFSEKTEEEVWNFKKWIIWISIWIIITQIAYYFVNILFDKNINQELASNFIDIIIKPLINLLETWASFLFLAMMIYAFYKIVTSNWDEEKAKSWKISVLYAAIWFIVVKISKALVSTMYWKTYCRDITNVNCTTQTNIEWFAGIVVRIIDWMNWFVWIVVILMIIYAWFLTITSAWDEDKLKKAKASIIYIAIWLFILFTNYLILTFFILPETKI